jgi:hypothetical protein
MSFIDFVSILMSVSFTFKHMTLPELAYVLIRMGVGISYQMASTIGTNNLGSCHPPRFIFMSFDGAGNTIISTLVSMGNHPSANAGHPHPESNFDELLYNGVPHAAQSNTP